MKHILPLTLALALPALAGSPVSTPVQAPAPAPAPCCPTQWFVAASYGQFDADYAGSIERSIYGSGTADLDMYSLQFGRTLGCLGSFNQAAYLEIGWLTGDTGSADFNGSAADIDVIPVTLNYRLEHTIIGGLSAYASVGAGYAMSILDVPGVGDGTDGGFIAQASLGLSYKITPAFEIFGGARWLYMDDINGSTTGNGSRVDGGFDGGDTIGWEAGLRYSF